MCFRAATDVFFSMSPKSLSCFLLASVLLNGCGSTRVKKQSLTPATEIKCVVATNKNYREDKSTSGTYKGQTHDFIVNTQTGNYYLRDEFSGRIVSQMGTLELPNTKSTRVIDSVIAGDEWKMRKVLFWRHKMNKVFEEMWVINLKTMKFTVKTSVDEDIKGLWIPLETAEGSCLFVKPKTTDVIKVPTD